MSGGHLDVILKRRTMMALLLFGALAAASDARAIDRRIATRLAKRELAPTGRLRIAIAVGPAPSALFAVRDEATGELKGVTVALGQKLAQRLRIPYEFVVYQASGEIQNSADSGAWDVTFMPVDEERKKFVEFGAPYHLLESTYLVPAAGTIKTIEEVNRPGIRVIGIKNTATIRASIAHAPKAEHFAAPSVDEAVAHVKEGKADVIALSRESLNSLLPNLPGAAVLDGAFLNSTTAVAVPKNRAKGLALVSAFIEEAKSSGLVREAFDEMGLKDAKVAPLGMQP